MTKVVELSFFVCLFVCDYRIFVLTGRRGEVFWDCNGDTAKFVCKKRGGNY